MNSLVWKLVAGFGAILIGSCLALVVGSHLASGVVAMFRSLVGLGIDGLIVVPGLAVLLAVALLAVLMVKPMTLEARQRIKALILILLGLGSLGGVLVGLAAAARREPLMLGFLLIASLPVAMVFLFAMILGDHHKPPH